MSGPAQVNVCRIRLDRNYRLSPVHVDQIVYHMKHMIGVTFTVVRGQDIYVLYQPGEASARKVRNYLGAALHPFGAQWREAALAAHAVRFDDVEYADDAREAVMYCRRGVTAQDDQTVGA